MPRKLGAAGDAQLGVRARKAVLDRPARDPHMAREDYAKMQYYEMFRDGKNVYTEHFQTEANETDPNLAPGTTKIK